MTLEEMFSLSHEKSTNYGNWTQYPLLERKDGKRVRAVTSLEKKGLHATVMEALLQEDYTLAMLLIADISVALHLSSPEEIVERLTQDT